MKKFTPNIILIMLALLFSNMIKAQLEFINAFPNLSFTQPVDIQSPPDGTDRIFVLSQPGVIYSFNNDPNATEANVFLDLRNRVLSDGFEEGLLGLAFHPDYVSNGYFFVNYTRSNPRRTVISRFKVSDSNANEADVSSELVLMEVNQPFPNHNGGQIAFGPDGYLYISFGDGGSGGDPQGHGQNRQTLLGSIARIDIDNTSGNLNYSIPADNPFVGNSDGWQEEIYAYGLRNVWRFSFDPVTNNLWAADVGQNQWEEINLIENGGNYGWKIMEGNHCFSPSSNCNQNGLELPVWEYFHSNNNVSVTGGYAYRGNNAEELRGKYIYGDYVSGNIWALDISGQQPENEQIFSTNNFISTFGVDQNNDLYFASYNSGILYKITGTPVTSVQEEIPNDYKLEQNYPNPFNPSTVINYSLASAGNIKLIVFNILGNEIKQLVNKRQSPGNYSITFNADGLASGIYYYQLITDNFVETKKMILLR